MGVMRFMGQRTGDEEIAWEVSDPDAVQRARKKFNKLVKPKKKDGKFKAYHVVTKGGKRQAGAPMERFDANAGEVLLVPQMAGG